MTEQGHTEVRVYSEGLSVSMYDGMELVDELWLTWPELELIKEENKDNRYILE